MEGFSGQRLAGRSVGLKPDKPYDDILLQMIMMKEVMQQEYRELGDTLNDPKADSRAQLRALKKQARLAVQMFEFSLEIAYAAKKLGYGAEKASSRRFKDDVKIK